MITCWMISSVRSFYDLDKVKDVTRWIWSLFSYNGHKQLEVRFLLWIICGREIFVLSSGVACARTIGSLRTICSFSVIMRKSGFCCLFVVHWDMPKWMVDLLACWKGGFSKHLCADSWGAIPLYVDYLERMKPTYIFPYKGLSIGLWS